MANRYSKDNIVAVFSHCLISWISLSHLHILCVCGMSETGRWGSKNKGEKTKEDQKTDEGWKKKIEEKEEKISQLTCD